uniref:Uncharacterized protein n=1 Tax=Meloidogyne javanica TaxID=6303 RepID=A0A915MYG6_MELJA
MNCYKIRKNRLPIELLVEIFLQTIEKGKRKVDDLNEKLGKMKDVLKLKRIQVRLTFVWAAVQAIPPHISNEDFVRSFTKISSDFGACAGRASFDVPGLKPKASGMAVNISNLFQLLINNKVLVEVVSFRILEKCLQKVAGQVELLNEFFN